MAIDATGASLELGAAGTRDRVRMNILGASRSADSHAFETLPGKVNYFIGNDPSRWRSGVSTFARVSYTGVLPGIDVTYRGTNAGTLEYDFVVAPGADPGDIRIGFSGARDLALRRGALVITTANGAITQGAPILYQTLSGERVPVEGRFSLADGEVGFEVAGYDPSHSLVIDPTLVYSTYLGGTGDDIGYGIAVDGSGSAYVTGSTTSMASPGAPNSTDFPTLNAYQGSKAGLTDAFVTKLHPSGTSLLYSTYLGGSGDDFGYSIALDGTNSAYVTGSTSSTDFPTHVPYQPANAGGQDAFVAKLDASGSSLSYSTYLGGPGNDEGSGIAVDPASSAYVTGSTASTPFPTGPVAYQATTAGLTDAFVTKLHTSGQSLVYSTYLGGSGTDVGRAVALDGANSAYVTGFTTSPDFPTHNPYQAAKAGGQDVFVTKLAVSGASLLYSTFLGGSGNAAGPGNDVGHGIAVDGSNSAYVTGSTTSPDFPTHNPYQAAHAGGQDGFVTKLDVPGSSLLYSTFLGGSDADIGRSITVDGNALASATGWTLSSNFPTHNPLVGHGTNAGAQDAFVTELALSGSTLGYSTYLGGQSDDVGHGIAIDTSGVYVAGATASANFPVQVPYQASNPVPGLYDAFITKLGVAPSPSPSPLPSASASSSPMPSPSPSVSGSPSPTPSPSPSASPSPTVSASPSPSPPPLTSCGGQTVTIQIAGPNLSTNGTAGSDVINGTAGDDVIHGLQGDDLICGLDGVDIIDGDEGSDRLYGDGGADRLFGGQDVDWLRGGDDDDYLRGDSGNDWFFGEAGDDVLRGKAGGDWLFGDQGDDRFRGGTDGDVVFGGSGADWLHGGGDSDILLGDDDPDTLIGSSGFDSCVGGLPNPPLNGPGDTGTSCQLSLDIP
jgi:Ca2+-binding RTX toxin-like protein